MTSPLQRILLSLTINLRRAAAPAIVLALAVAVIPSAQAQTFNVLHEFTAGSDGAGPIGAGLAMDAAGNLYGAANYGGLPQCSFGASCGTVFRMSRKGSGWIFNTLYEFTGGNDGWSPDAPMAFGPDGALYSTTYYGGSGACGGDGCGTVFSLRPPATACKTALCPWKETVLYRFTDGDGANPAFGALAFDQAGNLYGTTTYGGKYDDYGNVYELSPANGGWTQNVLYDFTGGFLDGGSCWTGVIFDSAGNLYGVTKEGGLDHGGTAFQLSPSGQNWTLMGIHPFVPNYEGEGAFGNLIFDGSGNLFGTNWAGGMGGAGTVYEIKPPSYGWQLTVLHSFTGSVGPQAGLVMDASGNLYGTTNEGGKYNKGTVFKLSPAGGSWTYGVLHDFTGGSDGALPFGQIVLDSNANLYGTTYAGGLIRVNLCGDSGCGVVWEITP